jgi:hypothetical protein
MTTVPVYHQVSGQLVPADAALPDMKFRDAWVLDGSGAVVVDPVKGAEITRRLFSDAIEAHIEAVAKARGYADATRLASYVSSGVSQWASEALAFAGWRDEVWLHAYAELAKVQAGERAEPTIEAFIGELPAISWPE